MTGSAPRPPRSVTVRWASERSVLLSFPEEISAEATSAVLAAERSLRASAASGGLAGIRDLHPGYCTLLVTLDPSAARFEAIEEEIRRIAEEAVPEPEPASRSVEIPVCYEPAFALDLPEIAARAGVDVAEAARMHAAATYRVCFLGFAPGFPYLSGLPEALATPRLATPRRRVLAGSVAIAGPQAGIYPFDTPGGWRIVGRTPLRLFDASRNPPALLAPGDEVRFRSVPARELE